MKHLLLIFSSVLFLTGCVYSRAPYGYSRYTVVTTPTYPRYVPPHYAPPPPARRYYYEYEERRPHFRRRHHSY